MESSESSAEACSLSVPGSPWRAPPAMPVPADFVPLRLILQPSAASIELTQPDMLLGRHSHADVRLPLPDVSRRHCRFLFSQGVWQVLDLNSLNGVFLNGELIRQATVRQGDLLRIGGFTFVVEVGTPNQQATEADAPEGLIRSIFKTLPSPSYDAEPRRRSA
ncbi:MAG TPA: FHA domain-containing protein [Gemmataceae bacterium]|nr:FHA domain-containing protein [Gemmataceae bacterium]